MNFLLILLRFYLLLFPNSIKILNPAYSFESSKPNQKRMEDRFAVYLPFWGWLELDAESIAYLWPDEKPPFDNQSWPDPPKRRSS